MLKGIDSKIVSLQVCNIISITMLKLVCNHLTSKTVYYPKNNQFAVIYLWGLTSTESTKRLIKAMQNSCTLPFSIYVLDGAILECKVLG